MKNKKIAILLVITLVLMQIMPTYAATATGSNADEATPSNADEIILGSDEFSEKLETLKSYSSVPVASASNAGVMLMSTGDEFEAVANTVDLSKVYVDLWYDTTSGVRASVGKYLDSDGSFYFDKPANFRKMYAVQYSLYSGALPSAGKYMCYASFGSHTGGFEYSGFGVGSHKDLKNAETLRTYVSEETNFFQVTGCWENSFSVDLNNVNRLYFNVFTDEMIPPYGGSFGVRFVKLSSDADTTITTAGGSYTSEDAATDTAVNTAQIAQNTADVNDTLKEIITHISDQLAALWDQLYNYMHLPHLANDDKNTQSIIDTLTNGLSVEVENNDDNTEEIIHGYDQSGIDDANDSLNSSITEYSEAEKDVLDSVNENLNDFEFEESFDAYVSTIGTVSDFLQRMYESSGALKDVINIGFFLSIAGIVVGLYRFKEG